MLLVEALLITLSLLIILMTLFLIRNIAILVVFFLFIEYLAINVKFYFGFVYFGVLKDIVIIAILFMMIVCVNNSINKKIKYFIIFFIGIFLLYSSLEFRDFVDIIFVSMIGWISYDLNYKLKINSLFFILFSFLVCCYQYITITPVELDKLWFYDYLIEKHNNDFTQSLYGYVRDGSIRPSGYMVGASLFGYVFISLYYLVHKLERSFLVKLSAGLLCFASLLLIKTRVLIIAFLFFNFLRIKFISKNNFHIILFSILLVFITYYSIILWGDSGSLVRVRLLDSLLLNLEDKKDIGINILYNQGPMDSQVVVFIYMFGMVGLVSIMYIINLMCKKLSPSGLNLELIQFLIILYIGFFQWSGSSAGILISFLTVFYFKKQSLDQANMLN